MFPDDNDDPFDSPGDSLSDDGQSEEMEEEEEEEEEEEDAEESMSQVTFDTSMTGVNFLTPGGLNAFTVALPAKSEQLYLKDLPKPIKVLGISKKNFRASINELNSNVRSLVKTVINENSTARSIHDSVNLAIKRGTKSQGRCRSLRTSCWSRTRSSRMCLKSCAKPRSIETHQSYERRQHQRP
jgi:hypothetical protein